MEEFKRFTLGPRSFNPYDPHFLVMDHCTRVKHPWIHEVCHWPKEDPWRYFYHFSRLNEPANIVVEWLAKKKPAKSLAIADGSRPVDDKWKRKVVDSAEAEQSYKFKENPLVMKVTLENEAKRQQHDRRIA